MGLTVSELKKVFAQNGKNERTLVGLLHLLAPLCLWDEVRIKEWMVNPKVFWHELTPLERIKMGKIKAVKDVIKAHLEGDAPVGG